MALTLEHEGNLNNALKVSDVFTYLMQPAFNNLILYDFHNSTNCQKKFKNSQSEKSNNNLKQHVK